ncbi:pyridoxal phosphate-dependent aminotransferase [Pelolinea submarina]|uniref:Aminotransferase n=1 Tax=Pelolinea submarina TaxID=913107 RepID=A0A347ZNZ2_9CHLR|nr:aminotransferase class I/II-fold pyridoxal phosphate-dependent enzyme [Pelolinea submarina]REG08626.1 aminotransferase [Pelolinea submarina]BBB47023.1 aminotransferase [Pelolinea submarina]
MAKSYLSDRVAQLKPSGIRKFFDIAASMKEVISLGIGEPDFTSPAPIVQAGIQSLNDSETHYTANRGILPLRTAISEHLEKMYDVSYDPQDEVVATVGGSEALLLAISALLNPGDEVLVPTPCFVSYQGIILLAGGVSVEVPSRMENNFVPDPKELEAAITPRTKAILINFPSNPTGAIAERETLLEIAKIAEKHDLIVISDEIYDRLVYGGQHVCFPALPGMRERTILIGGFSKDYAMTGWRIGYACAPREIMDGMARIHQYVIMTAPTMAQFAALEGLKSCESYVLDMVKEYDRRRKLVVEGFNYIGLPTFEPRGAFYAFPQVSVTGMNDEEFANRLLTEKEVAVVPGSAFGPGGEGFVRCSYATAYDQLEEALDRIHQFVKSI